MALVVKDRVKEVTTTTGTSNLTLGGAVYGFQSFSVIGDGNTTYYGIYDAATGDWEVGVGTYSTTGPTLSRDTVLESSNAGSKVVFGTGSKDVFVTYPAERSVYLDAAGSAVSVLDIGTLGVGTANITSANITAGTVATTPTANTDIANKAYVDNMASTGLYYHAPVQVATTQSLAAQTGGTVTYNQPGGPGVGVGATITLSVALNTLDGYTLSNTNRILVKDEVNQTYNGVYTWATGGTVLTRSTDADSAGPGPGDLSENDYFFVQNGTVNKGNSYICSTVGAITFGTTAITFSQFSTSQVYSAGAGLTLSDLVFSVTPVGTAGTFGSASSVPVFTTNAYGQITSTTNTAIAISAGAVSGLAPSATTDTTNASNITSGTLPSARLSGSYTGITGVGTLTAGTWTATAIGAAYGGTGQTSYAVGDLLYADTTTSLAKLADVVTGNALISGGVGTAPSWGKIGLQTHVSGTLQVTNGGTGATDASGARSNLGLVIGTDVPSPTGTGASGTWNINISGNAATATTATTSTTATSVSNSVTFNNSGTGAASGNGFNGSSALTVSYNTIGAPSTTGANASGTWGISISGNAATATSATTAGSATTATTATNLAGGVAGAVPYQSGTGTTAFSAAGTSGQYLQSNGTSAPSWVTPPTIGNGTLTMAVSGTGLSGSASFTANQSGNTTFTVTSNATNANTASTIVARDASGNFSAGTITAALSGNATTATTATQVGNSVTFNNGGAGGASGSTFNGSGALTVSYNTVGAPSTTGTGASGTWGISISGNAATATTATNQSGGSVNATTGTFSGVITTRTPSSYTAITSVPASTAAIVVPEVNVGASAGFVPALGQTTVYSSGYRQHLVIGDYRTASAWGGGMFVGLGGNDSYPTEYFLLNYGGSISHSQGYVTTLGSSRSPLFYDSDNTGYFGDFASTSVLNVMRANTIQHSNSNTAITLDSATYLMLRDPSGSVRIYLGNAGDQGNYYDNASHIFRNAGSSNTFTINSSGTATAVADMRAPIFYDSNDTGYYIDPNSTSNTALRMRGGALFGPNVSWGAYLAVGGNGNISTSYASVATTNGNLHMDAASGYQMYLNYYAGNFIYFGNGANGVIGSVSSAGNAIFSGNVTAYGSPSDRRLKENIRPIKDALATVLRLSGCTFDWKEDTDEFKMVGLRADTGFIADEVRDVIPSFVREDENGYLSLRDRGFAALLVEAIKELSAKVDALR